MASAVVNNAGLVAPEGFLDPPPSAAPYNSYGSWLSPRISFSHEFDDDDEPQVPSSAGGGGSLGNGADLDFEFVQVDDPVAMLPADELFSDGKLVPRQLSAVRPVSEAPAASAPVSQPPSAGMIWSPASEKTPRRAEEPSPSDPYAAFSPKAPTCTGRWRVLLRLRTAAQRAGATRLESQKSSSKCSSTSSSSAAAAIAASSNGASAARSLKHLLHRNPRPSPPSVDSDSDSIRLPSRPSLPCSSSSSAVDIHDHHPRLSLDADRPGGDVSISLGRSPAQLRLAPRASPAADTSTRSHQGGRAGRPPSRRSPGDAGAVPPRSASVDSPRMNSSGKVVFQGLGRSSSSPSALHGGPRGKSHAASVIQVAPVLNVAVCSLRGSTRSSGSVFGLFSSPQKKDSPAGSPSSGAGRSSAGGSSSIGKIERA